MGTEPTKMKCLITDCEEDVFGLACVNLKINGLTVAMLPACRVHGNEVEQRGFTVAFSPSEEVVVDIGSKEADAHFTFDPIPALTD